MEIKDTYPKIMGCWPCDTDRRAKLLLFFYSFSTNVVVRVVTTDQCV